MTGLLLSGSFDREIEESIVNENTDTGGKCRELKTHGEVLMQVLGKAVLRLRPSRSEL